MLSELFLDHVFVQFSCNHNLVFWRFFFFGGGEFFCSFMKFSNQFEESFEVKIQAVSKGGEVNMFICQLLPSFYFRF